MSDRPSTSQPNISQPDLSTNIPDINLSFSNSFNDHTSDHGQIPDLARASLVPRHPYLDGSALPRRQHHSSPAALERSYGYVPGTSRLPGTPSGKASSRQSMGGGVLEVMPNASGQDVYEPLENDITGVDTEQSLPGWAEKTAKGLGRVGVDLSILAVGGGTYAWEQLPENETFRGKWGVNALVWAHEHLVNATDPRALAVAKVAVATMAIVSGITMAVETGTGLITAGMLTKKDGLVGLANKGINKLAKLTLGNTNDEDGRPRGVISLALGGGAAPVVAATNAMAGEDGRPFKENAMTAVKAAAGITAFSAVVSGATVVAIETADLHGYTEEATKLLDVVQDGTTWWTIFGASLAWRAFKGTSLFAAQKAGARFYSRASERAEAAQYDTEGLDQVIVNINESAARTRRKKLMNQVKLELGVAA